MLGTSSRGQAPATPPLRDPTPTMATLGRWVFSALAAFGKVICDSKCPCMFKNDCRDYVLFQYYVSHALTLPFNYRHNRGLVHLQKRCRQAGFCLAILSSSKTLGGQVGSFVMHLDSVEISWVFRIRRLWCEPWVCFRLHQHSPGRPQVDVSK